MRDGKGAACGRRAATAHHGSRRAARARCRSPFTSSCVPIRSPIDGASPIRTTQSEPVEPQNALKVCKQHLDLLCWPAAAFEAEWVKSRGAVVPLMNETFLRLHDRLPKRWPEGPETAQPCRSREGPLTI